MFQASWHLVIRLRTDWPGTSDSFNVCIDLMGTSIKQVFYLLASAYPFPFTGIFFIQDREDIMVGAKSLDKQTKT